MTKRRTPASPAAVAAQRRDLPPHPIEGSVWQSLLVALISALLVARLLVPTEGTPLGDTLLLAQAWFGMALLWSIGWWRQRGGELHLGASDVAVRLLVAGHVLSALAVVFTSGDKRAAVNMLWEWMALGTSFFLLRQMFRSAETRRHLVLSLLAVTVSLSGYGVWQRYVWYPETLAKYEAVRRQLDDLEQQPAPVDPRAAFERQRKLAALHQRLVEQGVEEHLHQGPGRVLFESRLRDSREPLGRFALANSFAGLLLVWLIVLIGLIDSALGSEGRGAIRRLLLPAALVVLVGFCLLLTKSRTAFVGLFCGLAMWGIARIRRGGVSLRRALLVGGVVLVLLVGGVSVAALTGSLDRLVLTEAPKSLQYRLEYWEATWQIVRAHPLLGVGPGNFRQAYLQHKLPASSEEIADPHNLLLDAWVSGGLLALLGLVGIIFLAGRLALFDRTSLEEESPAALSERGESKSRQEPTSALRLPFFHPVVWGSGLGFVAVFASTWGFDVGILVLGLGWLVSLAVLEECLPDRLPPRALWGAAMAALLVHLLGAGGIEMPAIVQTLLVLLALASLEDPAAERSLRLPSLAVNIGLGAAVVFFFGCLLTATRPVLSRDAWLDEGDAARTAAAREAAYLQATEADPLASGPWERLAAARIAAAREETNPPRKSELFQTAIEAQREAISRDPHNFSGYRVLGLYFQEWHRQSGDRAEAVAAAEALTQAAIRYPHHATLQAELALARLAAGEEQGAADAARRALELDSINRGAGHRDKYLSDELRQEMEAITARFPAESAAG